MGRKSIPGAGEERYRQMEDLISRAAAGDVAEAIWSVTGDNNVFKVWERIRDLPSAQPTLYGYKIEHLAYIARVMQKEGVTAEYAVRTFDDMSRALRMMLEEAQEKVMEAFNERYDLQTGGN